MTSPQTHAPDAKAFLFLAGTLLVSLHRDPDVAAATVRLTATFKDRRTQQTHIRCDNRRTAEAYFAALGSHEATAWWQCFLP